MEYENLNTNDKNIVDSMVKETGKTKEDCLSVFLFNEKICPYLISISDKEFGYDYEGGHNRMIKESCVNIYFTQVVNLLNQINEKSDKDKIDLVKEKIDFVYYLVMRDSENFDDNFNMTGLKSDSDEKTIPLNEIISINFEYNYLKGIKVDQNLTII